MPKSLFSVSRVFLVTLALTVTLAACEQAKYVPIDKDRRDTAPRRGAEAEERETVFGGDGLSIGGINRDEPDTGGSGIGVNAFLWRASLDTISFMPLLSADAFGGVILTDWHNPAKTPNERFKVNVYILGRALRADGVRVSAFKQIRGANGTWLDTPLEAKVSTDIENAILTKARQLRSETSSQ